LASSFCSVSQSYEKVLIAPAPQKPDDFIVLTPLESAVIDMLVPQAGKHMDDLRGQLQKASIRERRKDETGFFTFFMFPNESETHDLPDMILSGIKGNHPSLRHGVDFILFIRNGTIFLEAYTFAGEPWPDDEDKMTFEKIY
jgi:hypothetical protein